ncbi:hypothetical protein [Paramaledivibacter caminithermalis]|jgi:hypothetical protein|uniref:TolB protein n=1 Tax=Paramaledivibacter caminithermalis (strain DSM 15212 / CIP 107654 / DViRD3) TaxID=1121301 RepID=A0A1M6N1H0_PARC5|nr:hypothetical protein [Paramaledivibacter caminithermalis]SHJ89557.1 hypothetical protein SAMN02745912_01529 [Paramaledivibacter caminithermalis DSM 15212]
MLRCDYENNKRTFMNLNIKKVFLLIVIFFYSIISGCEGNDIITNTNNTNIVNLTNRFEECIDISNKFSSIKSKGKYFKKFDINEYVLPLPEGGEIGDQTVYKNKIYYVVTYSRKMSNFAKKVEIYSYDINNNNNNLIYQYENSSKDIYINELRANEKYLFWTILTPDNSWNLYRLSLEDKSTKVIRTSKNTHSKIPPVITLTNNYLCWYETINKNENIYFVLKIYFINEDVIKTISDNVYLTSPYARAFIRNNILTYLTQNNEGININIYNIKNDQNKILIIPANKKIQNVISNERFTVWHENYTKTNIYVYDHKLDKFFLINSKENSHNIFAIDLLGSYVFVNASDINNIFCLDIDTKEKINLTNTLNNNNGYIFTRVTAENNFIAQNSNHKDKKCLIIKIK